ncbi:hypothetical protein BBJ28_00009317 [Nothophytophthora sp. Chile5]|nr:hypothetical protein BBJ28_00009317 [Nothophytophthora sp. Chile5]
MRKYRLVAKKGEGTFSEVLKAQNVKDSKFHAIKCMKNHFESIDQVNNLREIQALRRLSPHQHIVKLEEVLYDQPSGRLALVFELMDANLYEMIRGRRHYLKPDLVQSLMYQLVKSLDHMHNKGIFHRDIKPENILVEDSTKLKLADFGSCRGIYSKQPYTEYISTRWYRAPECLLTDGYYGPEMDMWGVGCVFFEITSLYPLFPGSNELDQIHRIHKILGTPAPDVLEIFKRKGAAHVDFNFVKEEGTSIAKLIPHASTAAIDLMHKMLAYDPSKRMNAREALRHEYFREIRELEEATLRSQQQQQQHVLQAQPLQQPAAPSQSFKLRKGKDENSDDKLPLPIIQNGSHGLQLPTDQKDHGMSLGYDVGEDELPPINGGRGGANSIAKPKLNKNYYKNSSNNSKSGEAGLTYAGGAASLSKPPKVGLSNGGSTNRSTYQDAKSRKIVANATLKKSIPSARSRKPVGSSATYADVSETEMFATNAFPTASPATWNLATMLKTSGITEDVQQHLVRVYATLSACVMAAGLSVAVVLALGPQWLDPQGWLGMLSFLCTTGGSVWLHMEPVHHFQKRFGILMLISAAMGVTMSSLIAIALEVDPSILVSAL